VLLLYDNCTFTSVRNKCHCKICIFHVFQIFLKKSLREYVFLHFVLFSSHRENNEYKKKDLANETYKAELHKRIKKVEKEKTQQQDKITKQEEEIRKQKEEIKRLNGKLKHIETLKQKYENKSESEIKSLTGYIAELNANIIAIESKRNTEIKYWKKEYEVEQQNVLSLSRQYSEVTQRLQTTQGEVRSLTEEKQELLLRY
jgi:chromosome segregation ATPase